MSFYKSLESIIFVLQKKVKPSSDIQICVKRKSYPSDMSKNGWKTLRQHLPEAKSNPIIGGRPSVSSVK